MQFINIIVLLVLPVVAINFLQVLLALGVLGKDGLTAASKAFIYGTWTLLSCTALYLFLISQVAYRLLHSPPIADPTWMLELLVITLPFNIIVAGKIWLLGRAQDACLRLWLQRLAVFGVVLLAAAELVSALR